MPRRIPGRRAAAPEADRAPLFPGFDPNAPTGAAGLSQPIPKPAPPAIVPSSNALLHGPAILPHQRILLYSPEEWEGFIHEWVYYCLKGYQYVERYTGAGDRGLDVLGFLDDQKLQGIWDNYQCKHYGRPLRPTDAWPEIGKVMWYTFKGNYRPPRGYYFVAPFGAGTTLSALLGDQGELKAQLMANWDKYCRKSITTTQEIPLEATFRDHVAFFDFSIFGAKSALEVVEDHRSSPYHAQRFGGGLPGRPQAQRPPEDIAPNESRYVSQLFAAYAGHKKLPIPDAISLRRWPALSSHFGRQREAFYHAESLRIFARDTVPPGTFESLQQDVYDGVVDTSNDEHPDGYTCVCRVTEAARRLQLTENALLGATRPKDRDGICHQLANDDRLHWNKS